MKPFICMGTEMRDTILIVDDEKDLLTGLARSIGGDLDVDILTAENGRKASEIITDTDIDLVVTDISMPDYDGVELLDFIMKNDPLITVIMMTAYGTVEVAVETLKKGAYDFIRKPFEQEELIRLIRKGLERNRLVRENRRLLNRISEQQSFSNLVGKSRRFRETVSSIRTLARTDVTVLVTGETGSGKDLAVRAIHENGSRCDNSFITVNCPALPEGLLESELFGYRKGAFTDAKENKIGLFLQAQGGTIFLDEIGDLSLSLQTKLLRVLQNREVKPLGEDTPHTIDVRIIAATNQNLEEKIKRNQFRADLYYRLNVASLVMPPLREMREDIPLLADHFLMKSSRKLKVEPKKMTSALHEYLIGREWPGNTRELENTITGWVATVQGSVIDVDDIPNCNINKTMSIDTDDNGFSISYIDQKNRIIEQFTKQYLHKLFTHTKGNVTLSAQISGIQRQSLQKIVNRYAISVDDYRN